MTNAKTSPPVALVTGANRGIGAEVARQLAARNYLVLVGSRDKKAAAAVVQAISQAGGTAVALALDVSRADSIAAAVDWIRIHYGRLDVLINNAGVALDQWVSGFMVKPDLVRETFEVNVLGPLQMIQQVMPLMRAQQHGRIVNVSSELASLGPAELGSTLAYRSSKTALNAITRLLALELKDAPDILINAACPGWVKTDLGGPDATRTVEEGADTIVWLATLPAGAGSGGLYRDREVYPW